MEETKMKDLKTETEAGAIKGKENSKDKKWETPTLEDVSEKIMAQPYIRFT